MVCIFLGIHGRTDATDKQSALRLPKNAEEILGSISRDPVGAHVDIGDVDVALGFDADASVSLSRRARR